MLTLFEKIIITDLTIMLSAMVIVVIIMIIRDWW